MASSIPPFAPDNNMNMNKTEISTNHPKMSSTKQDFRQACSTMQQQVGTHSKRNQ
jgi:hypothetical protein